MRKRERQKVAIFAPPQEVKKFGRNRGEDKVDRGEWGYIHTHMAVAGGKELACGGPS